MDVGCTTLLLLGMVSFGAGVITSITGAGAIVLLPTLLLTGMPTTIALGTSKIFNVSSFLAASLSFLREGVFKPQFWVLAGLASFIGSGGGALLAHFVPDHYIDEILPLFIILTAVYLIMPKKAEKATAVQVQPDTRSSLCLGSVLGIYSGFVGAATGSFWTILAMKIYKIDILEASGISRLMCLISNLSALTIFIVLRDIDYLIGMEIAVLGALGSYFGSKLAMRYGSRLIRPMLCITTSTMAVKLAIAAWF